MTAAARLVRAACAAALLALPVLAAAQTTRPRAKVEPVVAATAIAPGAAVDVLLKVRLPRDVHVQAHEPRDPLLIPTVLSVDPTDGVTVTGITYPVPTDLTQAGRAEALAVLGPEFEIAVTLSLAASVAGDLSVPAVLRYQACNDRVCFPPARATATWRLHVQP
ncbi:MAG: protein-disulfide reductase DsbD family protein [Vicinamibacterales bacterium]